MSPFLSSIKSDLILLIANVTVMRWFCWICSKLRFWRTHPVAKMITKKKKKKKILNLEPKYQVDMTAPEKYMRAAILSGGEGIFFSFIRIYSCTIVRCLWNGVVFPNERDNQLTWEGRPWCPWLGFLIYFAVWKPQPHLEQKINMKYTLKFTGIL